MDPLKREALDKRIEALEKLGRSMAPSARAELEHEIADYRRNTGRIVLVPGNPGPVAVTKIGGVPLWPAGRRGSRTHSGTGLSAV